MLLAHYLLANDAYMSILDSINTPEDLKKVSEDSLIQLCQEIRQKIIDDCAENPGHLGSSLGVVELTVALHYILDTPYDNLVWDVGHQSYAHKYSPAAKNNSKPNVSTEESAVSRRYRKVNTIRSVQVILLLRFRQL